MADPVTPEVVVPKSTPDSGLKALVKRAVAWEEANSRKIAATIGGIAVKSTYAKGVIAVLLALLGLQGCASVGTLTPAAHASVNRFECEVKALSPLLKDATQDVVAALEDGRVTADEITGAVESGVTVEAKAALVAFKACRSLVAPPPNPGDKGL